MSEANSVLQGEDKPKTSDGPRTDSEDETLQVQDRDADATIERGEALNEKTEPPPWGSDAPDGGLVAWLVVLGAWCTGFCSFGWINSIGVFQQYYEDGPLRQYSSSTVAWIPSLQIFFMMAMGPVTGQLFDRFGPRYLVLLGTFLHVFGLMMASLSTTYYQILLSQGVCSAIGVAFIFQPALNCIMGWFTKKRGMAYGLMSTGSSLGGVIFPIMVSRLIDQVGYGWAMRISAFLILGLLVIANLTVKARHPPRPRHLSREQMIEPFRETGFNMLMIGMFLITFGIYIPINYISTEAMAIGMDSSLASYMVSTLNAGSLFGRLASGFASDKIGKYNSFIISCYMTAILTLALWIPGTSQSATIAYSVLFGFFSGAYVSLIGALVAQVSPLAEIGYRQGLMFLTSSIPGLFADPIAGAILANGGTWTDLKVFAGVFIAVGTTFMVFSRVAFAGSKLATVF